MAITLAAPSGSDAEVTDGIGRGDLSSAALLWVRHWPTALAAAAQHVEYREVPGLAAEALIGTISLIATGRGPREDVDAFVTAAVRELGEDDQPPAASTASFPLVFVSPRLTAAFAGLSTDHQLALRAGLGHTATRALTVLQTSYLTTHLADAPTPECRPAHVAMTAVADDSQPDAFDSHHWLHLSSCAWCTEAFHELAFSTAALEDMVEPAVLNAASVPAVAPATEAEPASEPVGAAPVQHRRRRAVAHETRYRVLGATALTAAAAVAALVVSQSLSSGGDAPSPTAATGHPAQPTPTPSDTQTGIPLAPPATSARVEPPRRPAAAKPTRTPTHARPTPSPRPTRKPTHAAPRPSSSATSPTPSPSATPTTDCNPLQHMLAFC